MDIKIIDSVNNKVVGTFDIIMGGLNYTPSHSELFSEAWRCAVDDGIVDVQRKSDYTYQVV